MCAKFSDMEKEDRQAKVPIKKLAAILYAHDVSLSYNLFLFLPYAIWERMERFFIFLQKLMESLGRLHKP